MRKFYSWVWIKHAIRVRRNRNYIWYCNTANLNLHSLKVAKVDLFPLLFRLSSRFHCMGYSSRRLIRIKRSKKVIELLSRLQILENRVHQLDYYYGGELCFDRFERLNNYDLIVAFSFLFFISSMESLHPLIFRSPTSVSSLKSCFEFRVNFRERPLVNQKILINGISFLFNLEVTLLTANKHPRSWRKMQIRETFSSKQ